MFISLFALIQLRQFSYLSLTMNNLDLTLDDPELESIMNDVIQIPSAESVIIPIIPPPEDPKPIKKRAGKKSPKKKESNIDGDDELINKPVEGKYAIKLSKECFTEAELAINPLTDIFIEHSFIDNEELIKFRAVHHQILEYKCYAKNCTTKNGNWRRKLGYLILIRKNNKPNDLRMTNLEFQCPNCYFQDKGPANFEKMKSDIVKKCIICDYPLNSKYNSDKCYRCHSTIKKKMDNQSNLGILSKINGIEVSNMAALFNTSVMDESNTIDVELAKKYAATTGHYTSSSRKPNITGPCMNINTKELNIANSEDLIRLFMELSSNC